MIRAAVGHPAEALRNENGFHRQHALCPPHSPRVRGRTTLEQSSEDGRQFAPGVRFTASRIRIRIRDAMLRDPA
jgi:hypothetical protein